METVSCDKSFSVAATDGCILKQVALNGKIAQIRSIANRLVVLDTHGQLPLLNLN